jgi:hypothetical protein
MRAAPWWGPWDFGNSTYHRGACSRHALVREQLERLKLDAALASLETVLEQGQKQERLPVEVLDELLSRELSYRFERRVTTNLKLSGIPAPKTLESFDF